MKKDKKLPRRGKRIVLRLLVIVVLLVIAALLFYLYIDYHSKTYDVTFYQIVSEKVNENLRIVFISDLHLREYGENNSELTGNIRELDPDLILIGGDMVVYPNTEYDNMIELCGQLAEIAPVYGVTGNHENELVYLSGDRDLKEKFSEVGMNFLYNADTQLTIGKNSIQLVGLHGGTDGFEMYGGKEEMDSLEEFDGFRIVIDHVPTTFENCLTNYKFDLGLSGHVHGGIVRLPKIGGIYSFEEGFLPKFSRGPYWLSNGAKLLVSAGLGDSFGLPVRVNNNPELVVIDVNWY